MRQLNHEVVTDELARLELPRLTLDVDGTVIRTGGQVAWDYDVRRIETGAEYYIKRNVRLKSVVQLNFRNDAPDDADHMVGMQLATEF